MAWMRHKPDNEPATSPAPASSPGQPPVAAAAPQAPRQPPQQPAPHREAPTAHSSVGRTVNIGPSVHIKGTLSGREDLTVDGRVEGKITLREHVLTIGANGHIEAELQAKAIVVHGKVIGNVIAEHRVEVAASGTVQGDIRAPRVSIADGAMFRGAIDMGGSATKESQARNEGHVTKEMPQAVTTAKAAG
jgi:cytoskeletal protein CcmA (bactofilin family)